MEKKILVTGATGNVGYEVVNSLLKQGKPVKAAVTNSGFDRIKAMFGDNVEPVEFDFLNPDTFKQAFNDVDRVFLMRPPKIADTARYINPAIDSAIEAGVEHIVFLSLLGVEKNPVVPHYKVEKYILKRKVPYTFLRPSFFMQNLTGFFREFINEENELFAPAGKGKTSFIDVRDIAEIGAMALVDASHRNKAYSLTGNEALDYFEVAELLSNELHRNITYTNPSIMEFKKKLTEKGMTKDYIMVLTGIFLTAKLGIAKKITPDTEMLLGRPPTTMKEFIRDFSHMWK